MIEFVAVVFYYIVVLIVKMMGRETFKAAFAGIDNYRQVNSAVMAIPQVPNVIVQHVVKNHFAGIKSFG